MNAARWAWFVGAAVLVTIAPTWTEAGLVIALAWVLQPRNATVTK